MDLQEIETEIKNDPVLESMRRPGIFYVPGIGKTNEPDIMFIGEAPGPMENAKRKPFQGKAGTIFFELLNHAKINPRNCYITNAVKYMPTDDGKRFRKPSEYEVDCFRQYLFDEIDTVNPRIIATLGGVPAAALAPGVKGVANFHGRVMATTEFIFYAMYHPSYVNYNPGAKATLQSDMVGLALYTYGE
jgi:uracil-DNA glycosylase